jgi:predicted RNA methylase
MEFLQRFCSAAKRGELVSITVEGEAEGETHNLVLDCQIDRHSGELRWEPLLNCGDGYADAGDKLSAHLRTKRWMWSMLNDTARNDIYKSAIIAALGKAREMAALRLPSDDHQVHVLDIGTGSGLLSAFAADAGADLVTACEMVPEMALGAAHILGSIDRADSVQVIAKRSTDLLVASGRECDRKDFGNDMPRKADVLISELLDSTLIGEGVIPTVYHAWTHLLQPNAIVLPCRARVFAQLLEAPQVESYHSVASLTSAGGLACGVSLQRRERAPSDEMACKAGRAAIPMHLGALLHDPTTRVLSAPSLVATIDFTDPSLLGACVQGTKEFSSVVVPHTRGTAHALAVWWDLDLFDTQPSNSPSDRAPGSFSASTTGNPKTYTYTTAPFTNDEGRPSEGVCFTEGVCFPTTRFPLSFRQDHWKNALYPLPIGGLECEPQRPLSLTAYVCDTGTRLAFDIISERDSADPATATTSDLKGNSPGPNHPPPPSASPLARSPDAACFPTHKRRKLSDDGSSSCCARPRRPPDCECGLHVALVCTRIDLD